MNTADQIPRIPKRREFELDFARGVAVVLMIFAHTVYFLHNGTNNTLQVLALFGNINAFTVFLFISAAVTYIRIIHTRYNLHLSIRSYIKRLSTLIFGYYTVAIISVFRNTDFESFFDSAHVIGEIITFYRIPSFAEFLIPFIVYYAFLPFCMPFYRWVTKHLSRVILSACILFILGYILYTIPFQSPFREYISIFSGAQDLLRFPVLQYFTVFIFGLFWGRLLSENPNQKKQLESAVIFGSSFLILSVLSAAAGYFFPLPVFVPINRWPPSVGFLSIGLATVFFLFVAASLTQKIKQLHYGLKYIIYLGMDSYDIYIVHIILLFITSRVYNFSFTDSFTVILASVILLTITSILSSLNWKYSPSLFRLNSFSFHSAGRYRIKLRYILSVLLLGTASFTSLSDYPLMSSVGGIIRPNAVIGPEIRPLPEPPGTGEANLPWMDSAFGFYRQLHITNNETILPLKQGESVAVTFDHSNMVSERKSNSTAGDVTLAYFKDGGYEKLPITVIGSNSEQAVIYFTLAETIYPHLSDNRYFLYYGNDYPQDRPAWDKARISDKKYTYSLKAEKTPDLQLYLKRKWYLKKQNNDGSAVPEEVQITVISDIIKNTDRLIYEIPETNRKQMLISSGAKIQTFNINTSDFMPGQYSVTVSIPDTAYSRSLKFYLSYPVYVSWTFDWEGWDVPDTTLDFITELSKKHHDAHFTHYFNPRIYLPDSLLPERAQILTDWVLNRQKNYGDEIAFHIHMHHDVVKAAGIEPLNDPKWGYPDNDGYDVLTTAYNETQQERIIEWGLEQFRKNSLPVPAGFRAGGWFADEKTLAILKNKGFAYDSSGRDRIMWRGKYFSPWELNASTQPYYPTLSDQNISNGRDIGILEIPNNGGNTNEYTENELLDRFRQTFASHPVDIPRVVTFMSHPQWSKLEFPKTDRILAIIDEYLYDSDGGPVIYVTAKNISDLWK